MTPPDRESRWTRLLDTAQHEAAATLRREVQNLTDAAQDTATWLGTLRNLAERRRVVEVRTASDRRRQGILSLVGQDQLVLQLHDRRRSLVALSTVRAVRVRDRGWERAIGSGTVADECSFLEVVQQLLGEDLPQVLIYLAGLSDCIGGQLLGLGEDVLTLRVRRNQPEIHYLPLSALEEIQWKPSSSDSPGS